MIVSKIITEKEVRPNIPQGYGFLGLEDLGDTFRVIGLQIPEFVNIYEGEDEEEKIVKRIPQWITKLQGRLMLKRIGKYEQVLEEIEKVKQQDPDLGDMMEVGFSDAEKWQRISQMINGMAASIGMSQDDLDDFFIHAKQIELP